MKIPKFSTFIVSLFLIITSFSPNFSAEVVASAYVQPVTATLVSEREIIRPGEAFSVALHLTLGPKWHAYWKNPGDAGMPPEVVWNLPEGFTVGEVSWPTPKRFELDSSVGFGYEGELTLIAEVTAPKTNLPNRVVLAADVQWVVCNDQTCMPGDTHVEVTLGDASPAECKENTSFFEKARENIPQKSHDLVVCRKGNHVEVAVPEGVLDSTVTKVDFFPDHATAMRTTLIPHWVPSNSEGTDGTIVLPETGKDAPVQGIIVFHHETGPSAFEITAPSNSTHEVAIVKPGVSALTELQNPVIPLDGDFEYQGGFWMALVLAFVGGMILNLMPCVLPIISFKVLGFVKLAGESRGLILKHGLAFCGGVLLSFWALAGLLLALQTYGHSVGWGFQLQEPIFVVILASIVFIFALSLFGVFEMGTSVISAASEGIEKAKTGGELTGSFFSGVMATAVATPCTGPFLGSAVGFAVTLPPLEAMMIFTSIGLGMSLPYLALSMFPALLRFMPRPGAWMETFKQLMGFMMVATAVWLVWVFGAQTGSFSIMLLLVAFFIFSVALWIYGRWDTPVKSRSVRLWSRLVALVIFMGGGFVAYTATTAWSEAMSGISASVENSEIAGEWEPFSPERVAELRSKGIPVFVDFTAKWCLICQVNHVVLSTDEVAKEFADRGVVKMKADWTKRDEIIAAELKKFGRNSVPLYVLYGTDGAESPQILPQVLTTDAVISSLDHLEPRS